MLWLLILPRRRAFSCCVPPPPHRGLWPNYSASPNACPGWSGGFFFRAVILARIHQRSARWRRPHCCSGVGRRAVGPPQNWGFSEHLLEEALDSRHH